MEGLGITMVNDAEVSRKLSFAVDSTDPTHHATLSTLATVRFHAYPTIKKLNSISSSEKRGPARAAYYKAMYPDPHCPGCPGVVEDTPPSRVKNCSRSS